MNEPVYQKGLDEKLNYIIKELAEIKLMCRKMSQHIDFIDETYSNLKLPLEFIKDKVNYVMGTTAPVIQQSLPELKSYDDSVDESSLYDIK